jgi:hypothetical protein
MGIFDSITLKRCIREYLSQCPTNKIHFDDRFTYFDENEQPHDILYIEKDR